MGREQEDVLKLILRAQVEASMGEAEAAFRRQVNAARELGSELRAAGESEAFIAKAMAASRVESERLGAAYLKLQDQSRQVGTMSGSAAYKLQQLGGTIDDLQYVGEQGLRPILNNITQISPVAGIALIAIDQLWKRIDFGSKSANMFGSALDNLKAKLKALEDKPHPLSLDLRGIDHAKDEISDLEKRLAAFEAARNANATDRDKSSKIIRDAFTEHAGGNDETSGIDNVKAVIQRIRAGNGTLDAQDSGPGSKERKDSKKEFEDQIAAMDKIIDRPGVDGPSLVAASNRKSDLKPQLKAVVDAIRENALAQIKKDLGGAATGDEANRAELEKMFMGNRAMFKRAGIGDEFGAEIMAGGRGNVAASREQADADKKTDARTKEKKAANVSVHGQHLARPDESVTIARHESADGHSRDTLALRDAGSSGLDPRIGRAKRLTPATRRRPRGAARPQLDQLLATSFLRSSGRQAGTATQAHRQEARRAALPRASSTGPGPARAGPGRRRPRPRVLPPMWRRPRGQRPPTPPPPGR